MSALTTAAIIGLAASAGAGVASSAIQSHQAGKAVDAQTAAANKALELQKQQQAQAQQNMAPYQQLGQAQLGRLNQMASQPAQQFNPANYSGGVPKAQPMPAQAQQQPMGQTLASLGQQAPAAPAMGGGGDTVTIRTPDGRTIPNFPRVKVPEAMQRGAQVLS